MRRLFYCVKVRLCFAFTALCAQTQTKKFLKKLARQAFLKISCGLFGNCF
jgi:hypothetical protein